MNLEFTFQGSYKLHSNPHAYARKGTTRTTHYTKIKLSAVYTLVSLICTRTKTDRKDLVLETRGHYLACHVLTLAAVA